VEGVCAAGEMGKEPVSFFYVRRQRLVCLFPLFVLCCVVVRWSFAAATMRCCVAFFSGGEMFFY
jgi:hypothetical protein